jgi:hypothetical protein
MSYNKSYMSIIGLTILSPFNYQYGDRLVYVECGDRLHFDITIPAQKQELVFLVRPHSQYRDMIFLDRSYAGVAELIEEVEGKRDYEPDYIEKQEVKKPEILTSIPYGTEGYPALEPEMEVMPENHIAGIPLAEFDIPNLGDNSKELRLKELEDFSVKAIKDILAPLEIEYKNKSQAISAIIEKEYGVE